jgi:hypothetical protein
MLRARLDEAQSTELSQRLQAGMDALDPALLEKRAFELDNPRARPRRDAPPAGAPANDAPPSNPPR